MAGVGNDCHPSELSPEKGRGRYQDRAKNIGYPMVKGTPPVLTVPGLEAAPETMESAGAGGTKLGAEVPPASQTSLSMTSETSVERVWHSENDEWWGGRRHVGVTSMAVAAVLKRGDFFGLTPAPPTTNQASERGASAHIWVLQGFCRGWLRLSYACL